MLQPRVRDVLSDQSAIICCSYSFKSCGPSRPIINVAIRLEATEARQPEVGLEGRAAAYPLVEAVLASGGC